jgi:ERCC4-related helicase
MTREEAGDLTPHQAKYFAWELTRRRRGGDLDRISQSLFDATVDINPHQIDAAIFALQNPLSKGALLADEVGLGKTIEAGLVLSQYWAERRRRLIVLCPASLRRQWAQELSEKFHLPCQVLDATTLKQARTAGVYNPLESEQVSILSIHFAARMEQTLCAIPWDLVVIDEAHKLRNAHRDSHVTGQAVKRAFAGVRKLLLTATPLQNSLLELYGLSTLIDEHIFGDRVSFRTQFMRGDDAIPVLQHRLREFTQRTLRKDVLEYVRYTERKPITVPFTPGNDEQRLYDLISGYLSREDSYGVPHRQRHLVALILRKLLASSTPAIVATLEVILDRLKRLRDRRSLDEDWLTRFIETEDIEADELDELAEDEAQEADSAPAAIDMVRLAGEIAELEQYLSLARGVREEQKSHALLQALQVGFARMAENGAARKAVIFTESLRTQAYLAQFLEAHGYAGRVVTFSGRASSPAVKAIYERWLRQHAGSDRITGSATVDRRTAIIDHFREQGEILIATESGAEGVNLQFCSLVINYDLPWNPQRVEQRIGRCHRYGQQHDVVVINFLNRRNAADQRVLELLSEKFHLFDGVFGASDEVLGRIESGVDIERRIAAIYDTCRTPEQIEAAFQALRAELEKSIDARMRETEAKLLAHFDADIVERLRIRKQRAIEQLDRVSGLFWRLTRHVLDGQAHFDDDRLGFMLETAPVAAAPAGEYRLVRKSEAPPEHAHVYRLSHPLGEYVLDTGRRLETPAAEVCFDLSGSEQKISVLEQLAVPNGWLELSLLELHSFEHEEHLVFTARSDDDRWLDPDACAALLQLPGRAESLADEAIPDNFAANVKQGIEAARNRALAENDQYFQRERDKLDQWAEDQIKSAEQLLADTKVKIRDAKRRARTAVTVDEQAKLQAEVRDLERQQRRQRQQIFDVEDEIETKRDALIEALQKRLNQSSRVIPLFRIRWRIQ